MSNFVTEPKVVLVGKPVIEIDGITEFLQDHGLAWPEFEKKLESMISLGDDDAEWLVEAAGRLCYLSWPKQGEEPKGRSHEDHIKHLIEIGHGCYDEETEVLTSDGWKYFRDICDKDLFATRSVDGKLEYQPASNFTTYLHKGKMYRVEGKGVDLLVTPNHSMLVCKTTTKQGRKRENFDLIRADELNDSSHAYIKTADWKIRHQTDDMSCNHYKLLGFAIGDGSSQPNSRQVKFHLYKERKISFLKGLCESLNLPIREGQDGNFAVTLSTDAEVRVFRDMYTEDRNKQIPQYLFVKSSIDQLTALYEGLIEADGSRGSHQISFDTTSRKLANQFQQLCLHIGLAANICHEYEGTQRKNSFGNKTLIRLSVIRKELKPEVNKYVDCVGKTSWIDSWEGNVYCVEVPNHTLYVRRNGKPVWCGNSCIEHASFNFLIWNVSRSLTHELVRHRIASYSQISQRYVDSSDVSFIVPPAMQELEKIDPEAYRSWIEHCERSRQVYEELTTKLSDMYSDIESGLERRKKARQAARSVLPNATETKIVVTMNARAIRHLIELRANPAADLEIRKLAVKICRILQDKAPLFAHGLEIVKLEDGTEGVESKYPRV
ncbi:hypothetical protein LCGC14_0142320 [marine sediment metagenome]|uniref:DOD-type homing endonuclease domain-containing protein n=1 Tax=marine sediment metagenome TaxID=412755 RepID=A0A0F9VGM0_9ZZZZ